MELNEEEKRQLFQVDGDCQAKVLDELYIPFFFPFSLDGYAIDILKNSGYNKVTI